MSEPRFAPLDEQAVAAIAASAREEVVRRVLDQIEEARQFLITDLPDYCHDSINNTFAITRECIQREIGGGE